MLLFSNFFKNNQISNNISQERIYKKKNFLSSQPALFKFHVGDIIIVFFWVNGVLYRFEGICISIKKKNFKKVDVVVVLRNILSGIGVELYIAYFYNRLFFFKFSDFKRKKFIYKRAKLYYLRNKFNNASRIL